MSKRIQPIAVAIVLHAHHVLIGPRPQTSTLGGYWEFPGGKVEPHESVESTAVRECYEETGCEIAIERCMDRQRHELQDCVLEITFLQARLTLATEPHQPFRWVPLGDLPRYAFPPANQSVLQQLALVAESARPSAG